MSSPAEDPLRDSWMRYTAFTSDVGEAFKRIINRRLYLGSYAVVALYGALDTADKGRRAYARTLASRQAPKAQAQPHSLPPLLPVPASAGLPAAPTLLYYSATASSVSERYPAAVPVAAAVLDTALWHSAASLAIPCVMINRTVWAVRHLLTHPAAAARLHPRALQLAPPAAGLALIPLVVHSIDEAVTRWMDVNLRPRLPQEAQLQAASAAHR